jgi:hypothetical protein
MASVLDQLENSNYSLQGNGFNPSPYSSNWGYVSPDSGLEPGRSNLHLVYSVDGNPNVSLYNFNRDGSSFVAPPSLLDELDPNAPNNYQSQIYKSSTGRNYKDLGPSEGRY